MTISGIRTLISRGYDNSVLAQYKSLMQGVYMDVNGTVPFDAVKAFPGKYPEVPPGGAVYVFAVN